MVDRGELPVLVTLHRVRRLTWLGTRADIRIGARE
jgi:hypothetical protein